MSTPIQRLIRMPEVRQLVGLGRSTIYDLVQREQFPAPVRLSARAVAWREGDIGDWVSAREARPSA